MVFRKEWVLFVVESDGGVCACQTCVYVDYAVHEIQGYVWWYMVMLAP